MQNSGQRQVLTELLIQMDGVGNDQTGIMVLGATNIVELFPPFDVALEYRSRNASSLPETNLYPPSGLQGTSCNVPK